MNIQLILIFIVGCAFIYSGYIYGIKKGIDLSMSIIDQKVKEFLNRDAKK